MKNCVIFVWKSYKDDVETLYTLLVQHIGTLEPGSKIIAKHNFEGRDLRVQIFEAWVWFDLAWGPWA